MLDPQAQQLLSKGLLLQPFAVSEAQQGKIEQYLQLLNQWNQVHNLTSVRDPKEQVILHVFDCLSLMPFIPTDAKTLADVGSGAGLPALMIAIMRPDLMVYAIESHAKKTAFIRQAAITLTLDNVEVVHHRVETWHPSALMDVIVSRAMASANDLLVLTKHLAHEKTLWHIMKAKEDERIEQAGFSAGKRTKVDVPFLQATRQILTITTVEESL